MVNKPHTLPEVDLTLEEKVGQLFMPAVFINDSEEEVQKMEQLIARNLQCPSHHVVRLVILHHQ